MSMIVFQMSGMLGLWLMISVSTSAIKIGSELESEARFHRMFRMLFIQFRFLPPAGC